MPRKRDTGRGTGSQFHRLPHRRPGIGRPGLVSLSAHGPHNKVTYCPLTNTVKDPLDEDGEGEMPPPTDLMGEPAMKVIRRTQETVQRLKDHFDAAEDRADEEKESGDKVRSATFQLSDPSRHNRASLRFTRLEFTIHPGHYSGMSLSWNPTSPRFRWFLKIKTSHISHLLKALPSRDS